MNDQPTTPASGTATGLSVAAGSLPDHERDPRDMPAEYIAQLTHELYARTGMYPGSRELHERAMAIKAEVTRRLLRLEKIEDVYAKASSIDCAVRLLSSRIDSLCCDLNPNVGRDD
jgi:hypothetical protein